MSDQNDIPSTEGVETLEGTTAEQRDVRISADEGDDLPVTPPDMQPRGSESIMGGDADEPESLEQRIMQEEPDPASAYGAPDDESGLDRGDSNRVGGDDPDSIPADSDVLGDTSQYGDMAPSVDAADTPAEESALRVQDGIDPADQA